MPEAPWRDRETVYDLYINQKLSTSKIADRLGCEDATIQKWLRRHDIDGRTETWYPRLKDPDWFHEKYVVEGKSADEIGDIVGCTRQTVATWRDNHGIEPALPSYPELSDEDWLEEQYIHDEKTAQEIADGIGCAQTAVLYALNRFEIPRRVRWTVVEDEFTYGAGWNNETRRRIRERDGDECQACGMDNGSHLEQWGWSLEVHHIVPARHIEDPERRNADSNLTTLCRECHVKAERCAPLLPSNAVNTIEP